MPSGTDDERSAVLRLEAAYLCEGSHAYFMTAREEMERLPALTSTQKGVYEAKRRRGFRSGIHSL